MNPNQPTLSTSKPDCIGILGGMGPQAGLDLAQKILDETVSEFDQDHVPVLLWSRPGDVPDRSAFLFGEVGVNPAHAIVCSAHKHGRRGCVTVAGIACNTAHAPPIYSLVTDQLKTAAPDLVLVHLVDEVVNFLSSSPSPPQKVGILGTRGTYEFKLYEDPLRNAGIEPIIPDPEIRTGLVTDIIYHPITGVKAQSSPVHPDAQARLDDAIAHLQDKGAEAIVLGCTELPLALREDGHARSTTH